MLMGYIYDRPTDRSEQHCLPNLRLAISLACQSPAGGVARPALAVSEALRVNGIDNFTSGQLRSGRQPYSDAAWAG